VLRGAFWSQPFFSSLNMHNIIIIIIIINNTPTSGAGGRIRDLQQ